MISRIVRKSPLFAALLFLACGKEPSAPSPVPTTVSLVTSAPQTAIAGAVVTPGPTFSVKDQNGNAMAGIPVTITLTAGGGTITGSPATSTAGETSIGTWTLGSLIGVNTVTITAGGLNSITFSITTVAGPPAQIQVISGANQTSLGGSLLASPIAVKLGDRFGNPIANTPITFSIAAGEGFVASIPVTTNSEGLATAPPWALGKIAIPQLLRATAGQVSAEIPATVQTAFNIELRFFGAPMSAAQQLFFTRAAARLAALIPGDVVDVSADPGFDVAGRCGVDGAEPLTGIIDDVVIYASISPIDGDRGILAQAGPCGFRPGTFKFAPAVGVMEFDAADTALLAGQGSFQDVITHEMLHVLGIGTIWQANGFLTGANTANVAYTGSVGRQGCLDVGGFVTCAQTVPVANVGGQGSVNSHWREATFLNELMTSNLNIAPNPLSLVTAGSLEDLGYVINRLAADSYTLAAGLRWRASVLIAEGPWEKSLDVRGGIIHPNGRIEELAPNK